MINQPKQRPPRQKHVYAKPNGAINKRRLDSEMDKLMKSIDEKVG